MMRISFILLVASLALGQNDRQRYQSETFDKRSEIESAMSHMFFHFGDLFLTPTFGINRAGYDSNLLSQVAEDRQEDVTATPFAGVDSYWRLQPKIVWENRAQYGYAFFRDLDYLNAPTWTAQSTLHLMLKRSYFAFSYSFRDAIQRPNSEIDDRLQNQTHSYGLESLFQVTPRGFLRLAAKQQQFDYEKTDSALSDLNNETLAVTSTIVWKRSQLFWPLVEVEYRNAEFAAVTVPYELNTRSAYLGARNEGSGRLAYDLRLGATRISTEFSNQTQSPQQQEFSILASLDYNLSRRFSYDLAARRIPIPSIYEGNQYFISSRFTAGTSYAFTKRFRAGPTISLGSNDYPSALATDSEPRMDDFRSLGLRFGIPMRSRVSLEITFGWQERDSSIDGLDDSGFTIYGEFDFGT